jgi:hypothetical protein
MVVVVVERLVSSVSVVIPIYRSEASLRLLVDRLLRVGVGRRWQPGWNMDDDLQHPAEDIPKLLAQIQAGFDVVYGKPENEQYGLWRNLEMLEILPQESARLGGGERCASAIGPM